MLGCTLQPPMQPNYPTNSAQQELGSGVPSRAPDAAHTHDLHTHFGSHLARSRGKADRVCVHGLCLQQRLPRERGHRHRGHAS